MRLNFLDRGTTLAEPAFGDDTAAWPRVRHHVRYRGPEVTGIETKPASGGWLVQPASVVLALPGWEDAFETVIGGELHTLFDIEKLVRMLLHGSHLAMEVLGSSTAFREDPASREVLSLTLNERHLVPAKDSAATLRDTDSMSREEFLDHTRRYLQGAALARGDFSLHIDVLLARFDRERPDSLEAAREILDEVPLNPENGDLPQTPTDYERLSNWLVGQRLEDR